MEPLDRVKENLICAVCQETYRDPKILPCLHSFCAICLQSFVSFVSKQKNEASSSAVANNVQKSGGEAVSFECPTCREKVSIDALPKGIQSLPTNFWIVSMIDAITHQHSRHPDDHGCDLCDDEEATARCDDCQLLLCSIHHTAHAKARDSRLHSFTLLQSPAEASSSSDIEPNSPSSQNASPGLSTDVFSASSTSSASLPRQLASSQQLDSSISTNKGTAVMSRSTSSLPSPPSQASPSRADPSNRRITPSMIYKCSEHQGETLKLFCDSCQLPICRDCALVDHRDHQYSFTEKSGDVHRKRLGSALQVTLAQIQGVQRLETKVNDLWAIVRQNSNDTLLAIRELFAELKNAIDRREQELLVQVESSRQERLLFLHNHKENLEASRTLLQSAYNSSREIHEQASDIELLMLQNTLITRLASLATKIDVRNLENDSWSRIIVAGSPVSRITFSADSSYVLQGINALGKVATSHESIMASEIGKRSLSASSHVRRLYDRLTAPVLRIGSTEAAEESTTFIEPWGIAVSDKGEVVVADASRAAVHIESPPETSISRSVTLVSDKHDPIPVGVIFDPQGNIVVTDQANHMIKVLLADGGCKGLGMEGAEPCQFLRPAGIALDARPDAEGGNWIWVVDQGNRRVQAFAHPAWTHRLSVTQFSEPCAIAVDPKSHRIIVTDTGARLHVLQRGTHDVKVTITIKNYPNYDPDLPAATGVVVDEDGNAIIADTFQNRVFVVRLTDGQILATIGQAESFKAPRGLFISPNGRLFISDRHRIQAF